MNFINDHCAPLPKNAVPLTMEVENNFIADLTEEWSLARKGTHILKATYTFASESEAEAFAKEVEHIAEEENHHPKMQVSGNTVRLELWTDEIGGLSRNDFILATKICLI